MIELCLNRPFMVLFILLGGSSVNQRSGIDPDFRERSLTQRFVPAKSLSFLGGIEESAIPAALVT